MPRRRKKKFVVKGYQPQPLEKTLTVRASFLRDWRTIAHLAVFGHRNRSSSLNADGTRHHRSPTRADRRRGRARMLRLRSVTLRSLTCAQQGKSSSSNWAT